MDKALIGKGSTDAYVKLKYGSSKLKTKVVKTSSDQCCDWNQEMLIPLQLPIKDEKLILQVYDEDTIADEIIASLVLNVKSMMKYDSEENKCTKWVNLYGAPQGYMGSNVDKMNEDPELATKWKGKILMEYFCEESKYPVLKLRNLPDNAIKHR